MQDWVCRKCDHSNAHYSGFCTNCGELRTSKSRAWQRKVKSRQELAITSAEANVIAPIGACEICEALPSAQFTFTANIKHVPEMELPPRFQGRLCRICAQGKYREYQTQNMMYGIYGFAGIFMMPVRAFRNWGNYLRNRRDMAEPVLIDKARRRELAGRPLKYTLLPLTILALLGIAIGLVLAWKIG